MPVDLQAFTPTNADELFRGLVAALAERLGAEWRRVRGDVTAALRNLSIVAARTQRRLAEGRIGRAEADLILHSQELAMNQILLQAAFSTFELAQVALDTIFEVIAGAIRNTVGVQVFRL
jgi:hypothetical protein